jgi:hypothetical protein
MSAGDINNFILETWYYPTGHYPNADTIFGNIMLLVVYITIFIGVISLVFKLLFGKAETIEDGQTENEVGYLPEVEKYYIEKKTEELNREEAELELKERELNLRGRKRKLIKNKYSVAVNNEA